jgi:hypothetical protein
MNSTTRHFKQRSLKRQLESNSYSVDPEQVAVAIIIKLAQTGPGDGPGGPSRAVGSRFRLRQAA